MDSKTGVSRLLHTLVPFMVMAAMQKGILLLCASTPIAGTDAASLVAFLPAAAVTAALFRVRTYTPPPPEEETVGPLVPRPLFVCLLHGAAATAAMIAVMFAVSALTQGQATPYDLPAPSDSRITALTVLSLCLIHPVIEEWLFRGAFYGELRRMSPIFAVLAQAVMFAIVHNTGTSAKSARFSPPTTLPFLWAMVCVREASPMPTTRPSSENWTRSASSRRLLGNTACR